MEIVKKDTIVDVVRDFDTVYISKTKYKDVYKYDTLYKDSVVYLRDTVHNYQFIQPEYTLGIDAMKLVDYKLDIHAKDTVTYTQTVYETVYKKRNNKPQIGVYGGLGYDVKGKTFGPEVGVGVVVPLTKW